MELFSEENKTNFPKNNFPKFPNKSLSSEN